MYKNKEILKWKCKCKFGLSFSVLGGGQCFLMINYVHDVNEKINFLFNKINHVLNIILSYQAQIVIITCEDFIGFAPLPPL